MGSHLIGLSLLAVVALTISHGAFAASSVKDGDDVVIDDKDYRVLGVDAFEEGQSCQDDKGQAYDCGVKAKAALESFVGGRPIECVVTKPKDGRLIANCTTGGEDIGTAIIRSGWGFTRRDFLKKYPDRVTELCAIEAEAKDAKRGAWIGKFSVPYTQKGGGQGKKKLADVVCPETYAVLQPDMPRPTAEVEKKSSSGKPVAPPAIQSDLPKWVGWLQALTIAIASLAAVVGIGQWRTAHQRAVLDLFDKRFEVYQHLCEIVGEIVGSGNVSNADQIKFLRATQKVGFLFGPEVERYLDTVHNAMGRHHVAAIEAEANDPDKKAAALDRVRAAFGEIAAFFTQFRKLVTPYLRAHQKAPPF